MIPLGQYQPDAPAIGQHATVANNCIPYIDYYGPFYAPVAYTPVSSEAALSAFATKSASGLPYNFIGGAAKLQKITSAAWEDVSKVGGYTTASELRWDWTTFGNRVIATNYSNPPQSYVMGTSTDFADLAGSPPQAKCVATVRGFVMFGNTTVASNQLHWSALENPTDYTPSVTTQSDTQLLFGESDIGQIQRIVGGEYATIFMEKGIFRGTYVGGDLIFQFDQIIRGTGTPAGGSVASYGEMMFFLGNDGFYMLSPAGLIPIGEGSVNRTFFREVASSDYWRMSAIVDPKNSLYIVAYPTVAGALQKVMIYNWLAKKWTTVTPGNMECLFNFYSESMSADGADALIGNPDTGAYASVSADSALFIGGKPSLAGVDTTHAAVVFDGAALTATVETGEAQLSPGFKTLVKAITPLVEGEGTIQVQVGYRNSVQEAVSYTSPATVGSEGEAYLFNTARYQRGKLTLSGGFQKAFGLDYVGSKAGKY